MRRNGCSHEDYKHFLCEFLSLLTITSISAASGTIWYANNTIKFTWATGYNISGDYIDGTGTGYGKQKRVYVRMGSDATISSWVRSTDISVSARDYGPFGSIGEKNYAAWLNIR